MKQLDQMSMSEVTGGAPIPLATTTGDFIGAPQPKIRSTPDPAFWAEVDEILAQLGPAPSHDDIMRRYR